MTYGRRTVVFFEVDQPFCDLNYGESPCAAALGVTGTRKCFNTLATCQDSDNFTPGTLTVRFARDDDRAALEYGPVIACLDRIDTTPGRINLSGMEDSSAVFGKREAVSVRLRDFLWSDHLVDKYRLERTFVEGQRLAGYATPSPAFQTHGSRARARPELELAVGEFLGYDDPARLPYKRGTFWARWVARNPFYTTMNCRVREGYAGQALDEMRVRHYVIDRVDGPVNGEVTIEAKKALAPPPSIGELAAALTGAPGTFALTPSGIGSLAPALGGYSTITGAVQGWVAIGGKEAIRVTRTGDTCTVVERGALGTEQSDHDAGDAVQLVLAIETELGHDIAHQLITGYSTVEPSRINKPEWDALAAELTELFTAYIAEPTPINELVGEVMVLSGFTLWPEVSTGMIKYTPLRASAVSPVVTDRGWILDGTFDHRRRDDKRVSQVIVYFVKRSALSKANDAQSYAARVVTPGPGASPYGAEAVRKVFARFIQTGGRVTAQKCGERLYAMYRDPPLEVRFQQDASRAGELVEAKYFQLETAEVQNDVGDVEPVAMTPVSIKRGENFEELEAMSVRHSESAEDGVRRIFIDTDEFNIDLRALHDSQYAAPVGGEVIEFIVAETITVGSSSTGTYAMRTGTWPAGTAITIENSGRIQGKGGTGGAGGNGAGGGAAAAGATGGTALLVEHAISIDNTAGQIWGGAGGGGGGGDSGDGIGGGGGGGGAGTNGGGGGAGGSSIFEGSQGGTGAAGTSDAGGLGGHGGLVFGEEHGGDGGTGGGPGLSGNAGSASPFSDPSVPGGVGGAAGNYIEGNGLATWIANGDRRGGVT